MSFFINMHFFSARRQSTWKALGLSGHESALAGAEREGTDDQLIIEAMDLVIGVRIWMQF